MEIIWPMQRQQRNNQNNNNSILCVILPTADQIVTKLQAEGGSNKISEMSPLLFLLF